MGKDPMTGQRACSGKGTLLCLDKERFWQRVSVSPSLCPGSGTQCASMQQPISSWTTQLLSHKERCACSLGGKKWRLAPQVSWV